MNKVRVLIFDDDDSDLLEVRTSLEYEWGDFKLPNGQPLPQLAIETISDLAELNRQIAKKAKDVDIFLCDILCDDIRPSGRSAVGAEPDFSGLRMLKRAKEAGTKVCVAITKGSTTDFASFEKKFNNFKGHFDLRCLKRELYGSDDPKQPAQLIEKIVALLQSSGGLNTLDRELHQNVTDVQNARTLGVVEDVGQSTVSAFAVAFALPDSASYTITAISPGLSGAKVVQLTYIGTNEVLAGRPLLLKISRDTAALERELTAHASHIRSPRRKARQIIVEPIFISDRAAETSSGLIVRNGWGAIGFECIAGASALSDWIVDVVDVDGQRVKAVMEALFMIGGLRELYGETRKCEHFVVDQITSGMLTNYRRMAIMEAMAEMRPLIEKYWVDFDLDSDVIEKFLHAQSIGRVYAKDLRRKPSATNLCHGDFHARNILVRSISASTHVRVVDLASLGYYLWPTDTVRLMVDFLLTAYDRGVPSYGWDAATQWWNAARLVIDGDTHTAIGADDTNRNVLEALRWLHANRFEINCIRENDVYSQGEYLLTLAVEFLRGSYRTLDVTAPKRAFALVCASRALRGAEKAFSV